MENDKTRIPYKQGATVFKLTIYIHYIKQVKLIDCNTNFLNLNRMKLRNLLFGTMVALAFTACSSDNDPVIEQPTPDPTPGVTANILNLKLDGLTTKGPEDDAEVKSLTVVIADHTKKVEVLAFGDFKDGKYTVNGVEAGPDDEIKFSSKEITSIPVPTTGAKKLIVLANVPASAFGTGDAAFKVGSDYADLFELTFSHENESLTTDGIIEYTMSSKEYEITLGTGNHYMGYPTVITNSIQGQKTLIESGKPVILYRNVANVNLQSVAMSSTFVAKYGDQYPNASIEIKEVMILQAHNTTMLANAAEWGVVENADNSYLNYWASGAYNTLAATVKPLGQKFNYVAAGAKLNSAVYTAYQFEVADGVIFNQKIASLEDGTTTTSSKSIKVKNPFYVYENLASPLIDGGKPVYTMLVLKGDVTYGKLVYEEDGKTEVWIDNPAFNKSEAPSVTNPPYIQKVEEVTIADRYFPLAVGVSGFEADDVQGYPMPAAVSTTTGQEVDYAKLADAAGRVATSTGNYYGVMRNFQYNIAVTLNGIGYETPWGDDNKADAMLNVFCEVAPWGIVTQNVEIE